MPNLLQLVQGSESILPIAMIRYQSGENIVETMRAATFAGTKMKVVTSTVRASGRTTRATPPDFLPQLAYIVQFAFYGVDTMAEAPSPLNKVGCRCSCKAYYFWFSYANLLNGCAFGTRFKPYVRKTPIDDPRYPPKNPNNIPGLCKHLLLLAATLQNSDFYRRIGP